MRRLILISGGIGAGKSVVCHILQAMGFPVYDCDSRAKEIMDTDAQLCRDIDRSLSGFCASPLTAPCGKLDRERLAQVVFSNAQALKILNSLVHPAVIADLKKWSQGQQGLCFVESAIPAESGLRTSVDEEWIVEAPEELRIERVGERNGLPEEKIRQRIHAQRSQWLSPHPCSRIINNDGHHSLLLQIVRYLSETE